MKKRRTLSRSWRRVRRSQPASSQDRALISQAAASGGISHRYRSAVTPGGYRMQFQYPSLRQMFIS